jgi:uncharacterized membrane protein YuzA (DUF378 family)
MMPEWIIRIVILGVIHWLLAGIMLHDLAYRERVFGGKKAPWAILIVFVLCLGSLLYLAFHPQIIIKDFEPDDRHRNNRNRR